VIPTVGSNLYLSYKKVGHIVEIEIRITQHTLTGVNI